MRAIIIRIALPALALVIALIGLRLISWPLWSDVDPMLRTIYIAVPLGLLALALLGSAVAPDGARHRNLLAWLSISVAAGGVAILDRDYTALEHQRVWGVAVMEGDPRPLAGGNGVQLADGSLVLERHFDGHFYIDSDINGAPVHFLIDTGATGVALTLDDARRIGIRTETLDFNIRTSTAAGPSMAARVTIPALILPGRTFENHPALVMSGGERSLLGMTVLGEFDAVEMRRDQLILRP